MRVKLPLDIFDERPRAMTRYIQNYGFHFSKKAVEFAISKMKRKNPATGKLESIEKVKKEDIDEQMKKYGLTLEYNELYDYIYVYHMAMADFYKSSLPTEETVCKFVKDYVDDPDQVDGFIFNRWYADYCHAGIPIDWEEIL